jgi:predicted Zn-dependent protease
MARFFEKLNTQGGGRSIQFFSDHPNPDNREHAIEQEVQRLPQQDYRFQTGQFQQMKQLVARIKEPKPKQPVPAAPQDQQGQQQQDQSQQPQQR